MSKGRLAHKMTAMFNGGILSLDLASCTGWAHGKPGDNPTFGSLRFGERGASHARIYREFRSWLNGWITGGKCQLMVYESSAIPSLMIGHTNAKTTRFLIGLCEHVEELCYERVELREASVSQIRSHFLGTNRIARREAKVATMECCRRLGWNVTNDNEGDACALWSLQVAHLRPDLAVRQTPLFQRLK